MPSLAELQGSIAQALLARDAANRVLPADWFVGDSARGLRVHRNTVLGAYANALRLSYPTLARLLGETAFDGLAVDFALQHPPSVPTLTGYGQEFAVHVATRAAQPDRDLLLEVGQFDYLFEQVAMLPADEFTPPGLQLESNVCWQLASSLRLFIARFPVDELRDGATTAAPAAQARPLALWSGTAGVMVRPLGTAAAEVLQALLHGQTLAAAFEGALAVHEAADIAQAFQSELLPAGFSLLTATTLHNDN